MTTIQTTLTRSPRTSLAARPSAPKSSNVYCAGDLREARHDEEVRDQERPPRIQPDPGPIARVTQVKVVPQSGSTRFIE